nr:DNA mismatch repair protein msh6 [Ipomoea batatas]
MMKPEEGYDHTWILKPTASQSLNTIEDFQNRERRAEEENKLSDVCVSRFYEGSIASFDYFEKKHKVNYDNGDVEDLDLPTERCELIRDVKSAVDEQETVAGVADLSKL